MREDRNETALPETLIRFLQLRDEEPAGRLELLKGGAISQTVRFATNSGHGYVAKSCEDAPSDLYAKEADGLRALNLSGCPRVPRVISVQADYLLLEDLGVADQKNATYWIELGRQLATLHQHRNGRFGYRFDNYLGLAVQNNEWCDDGHEFYIQRRVLRYLQEGQCPFVLTPEDRQRIERFCTRLRDLVPFQPASLCHGDLWTGNLVVTSGGGPAYVDPAIFYGWPEADLGMTTQYGRFDDAFYAAYDELSPLESGWRDRLEIYHVKEWLSMVAHFGEGRKSLQRLREFLAKYT